MSCNLRACTSAITVLVTIVQLKPSGTIVPPAYKVNDEQCQEQSAPAGPRDEPVNKRRVGTQLRWAQQVESYATRTH